MFLSLQSLRVTLEVELREFVFCAADLEKLLDQHANDRLSEAYDESVHMNAHEKEGFLDAEWGEYFRTASRFPAMLRKSQFVMAYSVFENWLLNIASHLRHQYDIQAGVKEWREKTWDKGLELAQSYIKCCAKLQFPDQTLAWKDLKALNYVRNRIVHQGGCFGMDEQPEKDFHAIKGILRSWHDVLHLEYNTLLELKAGFMDKFVSTCNAFVADLFDGWKLAPEPPGLF